MFRSLSVPIRRYRVVLLNAVAQFVSIPQQHLCVYLACFGSHSIPLQRSLRIRSAKPTYFVSSAQPHLSFGVTLLRCREQPLLSDQRFTVCKHESVLPLRGAKAAFGRLQEPLCCFLWVHF